MKASVREAATPRRRKALSAITALAAAVPAWGQTASPGAGPANGDAQAAASTPDFSGIWAHLRSPLLLAIVAVALGLALPPENAAAQSVVPRQIRLIVPFPAGGNNCGETFGATAWRLGQIDYPDRLSRRSRRFCWSRGSREVRA
jgi:hypothetical protein